jgi:hypothetical protein
LDGIHRKSADRIGKFTVSGHSFIPGWRVHGGKDGRAFSITRPIRGNRRGAGACRV